METPIAETGVGDIVTLGGVEWIVVSDTWMHPNKTPAHEAVNQQLVTLCAPKEAFTLKQKKGSSVCDSCILKHHVYSCPIRGHLTKDCPWATKHVSIQDIKQLLGDCNFILSANGVTIDSRFAR
jgi:hypothetical protein